MRRPTDGPEPKPAVIDPPLINQARDGDLAVTRTQQAAHAIKHIGDSVLEEGRPITVHYEPPTYAAVIGAPSMNSAAGLMLELASAEKIKWDEQSGRVPWATVDLTLEGWELYEAMTRRSYDGSYGFFAWEFGSEKTTPIFEDVLKPEFRERSYPLKDMHDLSQPGLIDNIMQDRIRGASFVIVDLTDGNRGAYWEGGFAQALEKPVVYICEEAAFKDEKTKPHFDTNHYTIVFWGGDKTTEEFVEELVATLRRHPGGLSL